ncbi:CHY zinc finger protein [Haloferacaceae archaeon DSL9]
MTADPDDSSAVRVRGVDLDADARCAHYHGDRDVIAIKFACCETYYACYDCHEAVADHDPERWPSDRFDEPAVYCGRCGAELTVDEYLACEHTCPACGTAFNPGCAGHHHLYFER